MSANRDEYAFVEKWSEDIAEHGFTSIPNVLLINLKYFGLTPSEFVMLSILEKFRFTVDNNPWPSISRLSRLAYCTERHTTRLLTSLEAKGCIKRYYGQHKSTTYDLTPLVDKLQRHLVDVYNRQDGLLTGDEDVQEGRPE